MNSLVSTKSTYQRIVLVSRPYGFPGSENFRLETLLQPAGESLLDDEVLVKNHYLSLDPYMRGRMSAAKSYAQPQALNETMLGATAGVVVASKYAGLRQGDYVTGHLGWAEMGVTKGNLLRRVDAEKIPLTAHLGVLGMPGVTAWYGVNVILDAQPGQTLLVSAGGGAVGSVVGQLAKLKGCRVIGIAGGAEKCRYACEQHGFDACIDYKQMGSDKDFVLALSAAAPEGIDLLFENVGSTGFDASLACLNPHAKIALCGMVAGYNAPAQPLKNVGKLLTMRASLQGFIITEHMEIWPRAISELTALLLNKKLTYRESISSGLSSAPDAFIGMLSGQNLGKQLVQLLK
jgi:NADPH-dependent curcumin reductase CurA